MTQKTRLEKLERADQLGRALAMTDKLSPAESAALLESFTDAELWAITRDTAGKIRRGLLRGEDLQTYVRDAKILEEYGSLTDFLEQTGLPLPGDKQLIASIESKVNQALKARNFVDPGKVNL